MAEDRSIRVRLIADINQYRQAMGQAAAATGDFAKQVSGHGTAAKADIEQVGRTSLLMAGGLAVGIGLSVKAAMDWETAWAGVTKTVNGSASEMADLEEGLRGLAKTLPATHEEIAGVAEAAGQLGVQRENIVSFTKTMIDLGETTNLTAEQAATGLAQIMNVMGTAPDKVDELGSALVALGNAGASTESDILEMSKRLAGAGELVGASEDQVLALANAMSSMGIEAQLGGGAFSRVMLKIFSSVKDGGDKLEAFAKIAGTSASDFAAQFEADPIRAIDGFIQGLNRIDESGGNVVSALSEVGIKGTQDLQVLLRLKGAGDLLAESLDLGSDAVAKNTALTEEAEKRYGTTAAQLEIMRNNAVDVAIDFGTTVLPAIISVADSLTTLAQGFGALPGPIKDSVLVLGGLLTAGLGVVGVIGVIGPKIDGLKASLNNMGSAGQFVSANLGKFAIGLGIAGAAVAALTYIMGQQEKKAADAKRETESFLQSMREAGGAAEGARSHIEDVVLATPNLAKAMESAGVSLDSMTASLLGNDDAYNKLRLSIFHAAGDIGLSLQATSGLTSQLDSLRSGAMGGKEGLDSVATVIGETGEKAAGALPAVGAFGRELGLTADEADAAAKAIKEFNDANAAAVDPLFGMADAIDTNFEANKKLNEALIANIDTIADNNVGAEEMAKLQREAGRSALDMNAAAVTLAAGIQNGTVNIDIAKQMLAQWVSQGAITAEAAAGLSAQFDTAATKAEILAGKNPLNIDVTTSGIEEAIRNLDRLNGVAGGITRDKEFRVIQGGGKYTMRMGGIVHAAEGFIGTASMGTLWNEPATGDEAYIPHNIGHARGLALANVAAGWHGGTVVPAGGMFHGGNTTAPSAAVAAGSVHVTNHYSYSFPNSVISSKRQLLTMLRSGIRTTGQSGDIQRALGAPA